MRFGEVLNGYHIITHPINISGGACLWAFATKGGREYFIKEFLCPKWPTSESVSTPARKALRRAECQEFERRHRDVMRRLVDAMATPGGGNLVTAADFFRSGTTYYKVTEKIVTVSLSSFRGLSVHERAVIFRTLVLSVQMLHRKEIVHGDLNPANVLIQKIPGSGLHTAKLIGFDDCYLSGCPPLRDQIVGDSLYGAPEWFGYIRNEGTVLPSTLTTAADIFALALLFHHYLTDSLPGQANSQHSAPGEAVRAGERLLIDGGLSPGFITLLEHMLAPQPRDRPTVDQVFTELQDEALLTVIESTR